jgi:B12 binding protein
VNGDAKKARAVTEAMLSAGASAMGLIQESMVPAMDEVGRLFEAEEYFVPELLLSGRAMKTAMELIKPLLSATGQRMKIRVLIGTVKGDLHDIGKNIVASMLEGGGPKSLISALTFRPVVLSKPSVSGALASYGKTRASCQQTLSSTATCPPSRSILIAPCRLKKSSTVQKSCSRTCRPAAIRTFSAQSATFSSFPKRVAPS